MEEEMWQFVALKKPTPNEFLLIEIETENYEMDFFFYIFTKIFRYSVATPASVLSGNGNCV